MTAEQDEYELLLYVTRAGKAPLEDWLSGIRDRITRQRVFARIDRLRLGNFGDCRGVGGGVLELRMHHSAGLRVYFTLSGRRQITLLCGGDNSKQQTDIERAARFRRDLMTDAD